MANFDEIYKELTQIFRDVLDNDDIDLSPATTAQDVQGWDSLAHISLIVAVERTFKIRFDSAEIGALTNVGELATLVAARTASA